MPKRLTPYDLSAAWVELATGILTSRAADLMRILFGDVASVSSLPAIVNRKTLAELNALALVPADENYLAFEYNYGHMLRWTGTTWQFAPGDPGNAFWSLRPIAPQEVGWQLCDGTVTDYLTVGGATLTVTAHTTPNVTAGTFLKVLAAYTGTIEAAIAAGISGTPSISGSTGESVADVAGNTGSTAPGTGPPNGGSSEVDFNNDGVTKTVATNNHDHPVDNHAHGAGTLAVVLHAHDEGTLAVALGTVAVDAAARPPSLGGLLYFRR